MSGSPIEIVHNMTVRTAPVIRFFTTILLMMIVVIMSGFFVIRLEQDREEITIREGESLTLVCSLVSGKR